jgi:hypothetical protein
MAFETYPTKLAGIHRASTLLHELRQMYQTGKIVQQKLTDYQAATDPAMNAAVNALFTAAERVELNTMLTQVNTLIADWEANHATALGL